MSRPAYDPNYLKAFLDSVAKKGPQTLYIQDIPYASLSRLKQAYPGYSRNTLLKSILLLVMGQTQRLVSFGQVINLRGKSKTFPKTSTFYVGNPISREWITLDVGSNPTLFSVCAEVHTSIQTMCHPDTVSREFEYYLQASQLQDQTIDKCMMSHVSAELLLTNTPNILFNSWIGFEWFKHCHFGFLDQDALEWIGEPPLGGHQKFTGWMGLFPAKVGVRLEVYMETEVVDVFKTKLAEFLADV